MRRILILIAVIAFSGTTAAAQDYEATISVLETRVAELEGDQSTPEPNSASLDQFPGIYGSLPNEMPTAESGTVAVVVSGNQMDGWSDTQTVIIHNNSGEAENISNVTAVVRAADGALAGASTDFYLARYSVLDGNYTIGFVVFGSAIEEGSTVEYDVEVGEGENTWADIYVTLPISDLAQLESTYVGVISNPLDREIEIGSVKVYCLNSNGTPVNTEYSWIDGEIISAGGSLTFETESLGTDLADECPYYLAVAIGMDW